jgi:sugar lactone lactonase YvrE
MKRRILAIFGLLLFAAGIARGQSAPSITQQPTNQTVLAGSNATFSVGVSGAGPLDFQWQFDGTNMPFSGTVAVIAGNGTAAYSGDGGAATNATVSGPCGVAVDAFDDLFIADTGDNRIRKIDANGIITTVAGNGIASFSGDGGAATNASLDIPCAVAVDAYGNVYIADTYNNRIRMVNPGGIITTIAGNGTASYSGDGGAATNAELNNPRGVAVSVAGEIYIGDFGNNVVRKVNSQGFISTVASGSEPIGVAVDLFGALYFVDFGDTYVRKLDTNGVLTSLTSSLPHPIAVAVDAHGNLFVADYNDILAEAKAGVDALTTLNVNGSLGVPFGLAVDASDNIFAAAYLGNDVLEVASPGPTLVLSNVNVFNAGSYDLVVTSPADSVTSSVATLTVLAPPAIMAQPVSQTVPAGSNAIFSVAAIGPPTSSYQWYFDGAAMPGQTNGTLSLTGIYLTTAGSYNVVVTNLYGAATSSVATLTVSVLTGQPQSQSAGVGSSVTFNVTTAGTTLYNYQWFFDGSLLSGQTNSSLSFSPVEMTNAGSYEVVVSNIYASAASSVAILTVGYSPVIVLQPSNQTTLLGGNATFAVTVSGTGPFSYQWQFNGTNLPNNIINLFAGASAAGYSGDGGPATNAQLTAPAHLSVDTYGSVFIADAGTNRIRKVNAAGIISTVAGKGSRGYSGDGGQATNASLNMPTGVAADAYGNFFIADTANNRIRKVNTNGVISTVAGYLTNGYSGDGGQATNARLFDPHSVAVDATGQLFIADTFNNRIRKVATNGIITTVAGSGPSFPSIGSYAGDGGSATNAKINSPEGVAVDTMGDLFIADVGNNRIREVGTNGIITTVAGDENRGYSGDEVAATNTSLWEPFDVLLDTSGNMFIADGENRRVRRVSINGIITTVAGGGSESGLLGQLATNAYLGWPVGLAVDAYGDIFMAQSDVEPPQVARVIIQGPAFLVNNVSYNNVGSYDVIVTGPYGSVTSSVALLTVLAAPLITAQPLSQFAPVGGNAAFSVAVISPPTFEYHWQFDGTNLDNATNASLALADVSTNEAGSYTVVVTNNYGSVTSAVAVLAVGLAPVINSEPSCQTALVGGAASFTVAVSGTGPFTYQWQLNGVNLPNPVIITAAGQDTGGLAPNTSLDDPSAVTADAAGNLFIADQFNDRICKVRTNGILTTVAGTLSYGSFGSYSGDGGAATNANLALPAAVAVDNLGNVFIADMDNNRIRQVNTAGIITTIAGNGTYGYSGDGGPATNAELSGPSGLVVDPDGNLFIADSGTNRILELTDGIITTVVGTGLNGFSGDGGPALNATLNYPTGLALDASGNLFIVDENNQRIREVATNGIITTVAGNGSAAYSGDGGPATNASLYYPTAVAVDAFGNLFIADGNNSVIREVETNGIISTIAGRGGVEGFTGDGGLAINAELGYAQGVAVDSSGYVIIADTDNGRVRRTKVGSVINTIAGGGIGDGGAAVNAYVRAPLAMAMDTSGNLFYCDTGNNRVREIATNGIIVTVAGTGSYGYTGNGGPATNATLSEPYAVAVDNIGEVFIMDYENSVIRKVGTNGTITTVAGGGTNANGDGIPATNATVSYVRGMAVDSLGNLFFADTYSNRIREVTTNGIITTVAGTGVAGFSGDGGPAANATFDGPWGITFDNSGNLFVADWGNSRIRRIDADGFITTVAGDGTAGFSGDGGPATNAALDHPYAVAVADFGDLFIADGANYRVREVCATGTITTLAGNGTAGFRGDGGLPINAELDLPIGVAVNAAGNVFIADFENDRIREVLYQTPTLALSNIGGASAGMYDLVVTSPYGSVTSSIANLNVALPPLNAYLGAGHGVQFQFAGTAGTPYVLLVATNLTPPVNWQPLVTNAADAGGNWSYTETNMSNPTQFYRAMLMTP